MALLRTYTMRGQKVRLHPECRSGFRTDRACGLIYGPYKINGKFAKNAEEASMLANFCPYCGGGEDAR